MLKCRRSMKYLVLTETSFSFVFKLTTNDVDLDFMPQKNMAAFYDQKSVDLFISNAFKLGKTLLHPSQQLKTLSNASKGIHRSNLSSKHITSVPSKHISSMPATFTSAPMFTSKVLDKSLYKKMNLKSNVHLAKSNIEQLKVVGQFDHKFIVCDGGSRESSWLMMFDPHASEERILLEEYTRLYFNQLDSREDVITHRIQIPCYFQCLAEENRSLLLKHGISIDLIRLPLPDMAASSITSEVMIPRILFSDIHPIAEQVQIFVLKVLNWIQKLGAEGTAVLHSVTPKPIMDKLASKACR
jgi:hypothetical protein